MARRTRERERAGERGREGLSAGNTCNSSTSSFVHSFVFLSSSRTEVEGSSLLFVSQAGGSMPNFGTYS